MDNTNGNLPTFASKMSKPFILRYENPKIFMIIESACDSHENPSSSNSKMPDWIPCDNPHPQKLLFTIWVVAQKFSLISLFYWF